MVSDKDDYPWFRLEAPALAGLDLQVRSVVGRERIAEPYRFVIEARVPGEVELDLEALLRDSATLIFLRGREERRRVHGAIVAASDRSEPDAGHATWELELGPRLSDLGLNQRLEVAVDQSIPTILQNKLVAAGLEPDKDFAITLAGVYPAREFTVQYEESDLDYLRRLTEHAGIAFTFVHDDGRDKLIVLDNNDAYPQLPDVPYRSRDEGGGVYRLTSAVRRLPSSYRLRDYNYQRPALDVEAEASIVPGRGGEIYEFGANVRTSEDALRVARVRAEAIAGTRNVLHGESDWMELRAGAVCTIDGHPRGPQRVLIVEVEHDAEVTALAEGTGEEHGYHNRFVAIPANVEYRPPRVTPRPRVSGLLTGVIEGGDGEYAHLDEHGRYKVRLLFDDSDTPAAHASLPIRMAQPHAGPGYGMHFPLRAGVEVLIACIDGDPDRPVIAGCVPNAETPSPVTTNNAAKNIIRTGGGNEIAIDDTRGAHRIKLSSPYKDTIFQLGAPNAAEEGAITSTSGHVTTVSKGTTSLFGLTGFSLTATHSAWSGNYITLAEKNAFELIAVVLEGLEAASEVVIGSLKLVRGLGDKQRNDAEKLYEEKKEQADEKRKEADTLAAEYARHGEDSPTREEVDAAEADAVRAAKDRDDAKEALGYWEDNEKQTQNMEAVAAASGATAKLFSLIAQINQIHKSAEAVAKTGTLATAFTTLMLPTHQHATLIPAPPYHISVGEGTAAVLGEKLAFVSGEKAAVYGVESATLGGAEATVTGATLAELHSPLKVLLHATPADSITIAPGNVTAKSAVKTSLSSVDIALKSELFMDLTSDGKVDVNAQSRVTITGNMEAAMKTAIWNVATAVDGAMIGTTDAALPAVHLDAAGLTMRSGVPGSYAIDVAGKHAVKGTEHAVTAAKMSMEGAELAVTAPKVDVTAATVSIAGIIQLG